MPWSSGTGWNRQSWNRAASAATFTTFDPSNKASNATLSSGNLRVDSVPGSYGIARSIASISGTERFEIALTNYGTAWRAGLANGSFSVTGSVLGDDTNSIALVKPGADWVLWYNSGTVSNLTALGFTIAGVGPVAFEVDVPGGKLYVVSGSTRYPAAGVSIPSGTLYAAVAVGPQDTAYTANFGSSAWSTTATGGYVGVS